jgi:hypothetical protein
MGSYDYLNMGGGTAVVALLAKQFHTNGQEARKVGPKKIHMAYDA